MKRPISASFVGSSALALTLCLGGGVRSAHAQTAEPGGAVLEELIVTAERRTQNLQKVAAAATALTGLDLEKKGVASVDGLQFSTPSLTISNSGQGNQFNIRGIGRQQNGLQYPSGVVTYRDGIASFPGYFQSEPYFDIANIVVFRGPQGTFAGQNANGGAVFITTNSPDLDEISGDIQAQAGNYNSFGLRGAVNLPVNERLALRVAFNTERRDSFFTLTGAHTGDPDPGRLNSVNVRLGLLWRPTDSLDVLWKTDLNEIETGGYPASVASGTTYAEKPYGNLFDVGNNAPNQGRDHFVRSVLDINYTFANGVVLRSLTGAQYGDTRAAQDYDGTALDTSTFSNHAVEHIYSQEFNLLSPTDQRLRWVVGAYYQRDDSHLPREDGFILHLTTPLVIDFSSEFNIRLRDKAVFGQVSYDLTPDLELQAGLRYNEHTSRHRHYQQTTIPLLGLNTAVWVRQNQADEKVTGKVALNWKLNPDNFLYAFVATGHKSGGANTDPGTPIFAPEDVTDYEIGWKATFLDGRFRSQIGAFYNNYKDYQFRQRDPYANNGRGADFGSNIPGTTKIYGLEAQVQAAFGNWLLDASAGHVRSELPSHMAVDPRFPAAGAQDIGGRPAPYSPRWTASFGIEHGFEIGEGVLTPRIDYAYTSKQFTTVYDVPELDILAPRSLVNAQLSYERDDWRATAFATNLLDERYIAAIQLNNLRFPGPPRQFGIRVGRTF